MLAVAVWVVKGIQDGGGTVGNGVPAHLEQPHELCSMKALAQLPCRSADAAPPRVTPPGQPARLLAEAA